MDVLEHKAVGALVGAAVGDALGDRAAVPAHWREEPAASSRTDLEGVGRVMAQVAREVLAADGAAAARRREAVNRPAEPVAPAPHGARA